MKKAILLLTILFSFILLFGCTQQQNKNMLNVDENGISTINQGPLKNLTNPEEARLLSRGERRL